MDEQIVSGRRPNRERLAAELGAVVHGPQLRTAGVEALHAVGKMRRHHLRELGEELLVGALGGWEDAKADGGHGPVLDEWTATPPSGPKSPCRVSPFLREHHAGERPGEDQVAGL